MKSIFDIENRLDIQKEFKKFVIALHNKKCIQESYIWEDISVVEYLNRNFFKNWKYRDTMVSVEEFLEHIGVSKNMLEGKEEITQEIFLRYIEFLVNMIYITKDQIYYYIKDDLVEATLYNIDLILEKMNYKSQELTDRIILTKRDVDIDSIIKSVPQDIADILLEYNDFRIEKDIQEKKNLLKQLDLYIEKNIKVKDYDKELDQTIGMIVNKMGVNHPINEEPYLSFSEDELLEWYDKCFELMIHAIRFKRVKEIKEERKKLINNK